jgi:NAD(P)-dependent dehydrogenase (short-subunit alcohol dehydrogenase family)
VRLPTKTWTATQEYAVSKLANALFSAELGRRLDGSGVTTYALHPGVIATEIWRSIPKPLEWLVKLPMKGVESGAQTTLYCATAPELADETGHYYLDARRSLASATARNLELAAELWRRSEAWTA